MPRLRHQHIRATDQLGHFNGFRRWSRLVLITTHHQRGLSLQIAQSRQHIIAPKCDPPHWHDTFAQTLWRQRSQFCAEILIQRRLRVDARTEENRHDDVEQLRCNHAAVFDLFEQREIVLASGFRFDTDVGVHQHQAVDPLRNRQRQAHAPHATDGKTDQRDTVDVQMIEQGQRLTCNVIQRLRAFG
ncbi:hypothetical protein D3C84_706180 [compost metagenome]